MSKKRGQPGSSVTKGELVDVDELFQEEVQRLMGEWVRAQSVKCVCSVCAHMTVWSFDL
jgi:hypothetical protein